MRGLKNVENKLGKMHQINTNKIKFQGWGIQLSSSSLFNHLKKYNDIYAK